MKKIKKVLAVLLTLAMVMAMSLTAFAANGTPEASDTTTVTITGITGSPSIILYQISSGEYGAGGKEFIGYNYVEDVSFTNPLQPTSAEITAIANGLVKGDIMPVKTINVTDTFVDGTPVAKLENETYTATVNAGMYIAIITGANDGSVYNPILLSASYTSESNLSGGTVDSDEYYLWGSTAVAKKTTPDIEKEVTGGTTADGDKMTASVGDVIGYKITPTMPSYPVEAVNKTFFVSDTMSAGLTFQFDSLTISIVGQTVTRNENSFSLGEAVIATAYETENGFNLCFDYEKLVYGDAGSVYTPVITYTAIVNKDAVVGGNGNTNNAKLYYSNKPNEGTDWDDPENTPDSAGGVVSKEDSKTIYTYQLSFHKVGQDTDANALAGAIFGIYSDEDCTVLVDKVITNESGYAVSTNVKAGTYYIKEIEAPDGYSLNTQVYEVTASWATAKTTDTATVTDRTYTTTKPSDLALQVGWILDSKFYALDEYTTETAATAGAKPAYVDKESTTTTSSSTITTNTDGGGTVGLSDSIPNTKLSALPSTGGMGTTLFTIGGCIIMILAAALFFVNRRRSAE